ncbi:hypothetical protein Bpfe_010252 [Biomphalaria pfeifferi]|uniref:Uncharacterized protein n=1 Tax=Biomphalaria pfeifferi TaxID=112525 RepID=A0AAD8BTL9_BIOPF|nr:hypothetical protein Bpfe_010252 [Biomphalaria pfeifferi]
MNSFDDREHFRAKRRERARRRRTCRPWLWAPARIYNVVKGHYQMIRKGFKYVREIPDSEFDRQWVLYGNYMGLTRLFACLIKLAGIFLWSLAFFMVFFVFIGLTAFIMFTAPLVYITLCSELAKILSMIIFDWLFGGVWLELNETLLIEPHVPFDEWAEAWANDWKEWIDGCLISLMDN